VREVVFKSTAEAEKYENTVLCPKCRDDCKRLMSAGHFRVTGFNAKNGYNLPKYSDLIHPDGRAKEQWGKK